MGVEEFRIILDKAEGIYAPGDNVTGKVVLVLSTPKKLREIRIKASGVAEVHWSETRTERDSNGKSHTRTIHFNSSENYFDVCNVVQTPTNGHDSMTIEPGTYTYPFQFHLPSNIPCSFEHHIGHVRYIVKAVIDRPWRFDHKVMSGFTVIADYDLNAHPDLRRGIYGQIDRHFHSCLCFGNAGTLAVVIKSRVSGFVPGEMIELDVNYHNTSDSVDLECMKLTLKKNMEFHTASKTKYITDNVKQIRVSGPFLGEGVQKLRFQVPPMAPSILQNCRIIDVSYCLELKLSTSGLHRSIEDIYPIQIGTIPFYPRVVDQVRPSTVPSAPPGDQITTQPRSLPPIGFAIDNPPPYTEMPPPSYEECIGGSRLIGNPNEQGNNAQFAPRYPVYNLPEYKP